MLDSQAVHEVWISAIPGHSLTWAGSAEMTQSTADKELPSEWPMGRVDKRQRIRIQQLSIAGVMPSLHER